MSRYHDSKRIEWHPDTDADGCTRAVSSYDI